MGIVQESYSPIIFAANESKEVIPSGGGTLGGFFCTINGSLTLRTLSATGTVIINAVAVTAGNYYPLPFAFSTAMWIVLAGGAAGIVGVN